MFLEPLLGKYNFILCIILILIGLYGAIAKKNLIKKLIGLTIFQTAIILFFISIAAKQGATIPILAKHAAHAITNHITLYANPLPHVLMLTAIVVMVATSGVALSLILLIYKRYQTLEEDEILSKIEK